MKKIIILSVLLLNLLPYMMDGKFEIGSSLLHAQSYGQEEVCTDDLTGYQWASWNGCGDYCGASACAYCYQDLPDCESSCTNPECITNQNCNCPICQMSYNCNNEHTCGTTDEDPDEGGGSSSGGSSGGGSGGGSSGGGSGGGSSGNNNTHQLNASAISLAVNRAYNSILNTDYGSKAARCNEGLRNAFKETFGSSATSLDGKLANDMVNYWRTSSQWQTISKSQAQALANAGYFVVAGWKNSSGNGHVVVIVPGSEVDGWPSGMDTGLGKRWKSRGINYSWGRDKRNDVEYFYYK
jgi:hypothetical protein